MSFMALPEGSFIFLSPSSHASASGVLHATEGTEGTQDAAESEGKCSCENGTVVIFFFCHGRIDRETVLGIRQLIITLRL